MTRQLQTAAAVLLALPLLACASGGGGPVLPPGPVDIVAVLGSGTASVVYGAPGTADAGSQARVAGQGGASATVKQDGSFAIHLQTSVDPAVVSFSRGGSLRQETVHFTTLQSRVVKPLFATGSAPNDMLLDGGSIYVANSLDNTVARYGLDGAQQALHAFPQYASPSYLGLSQGTLWVVSNGANTVTGLYALTLTPVQDMEFTLSDPGVAFIGPSQPAIAEGVLFVPRNQIATFAPTTYGDGTLTLIDPGAAEMTDFTTTGRNPQYTAYDAGRRYLYVVCTGEIQFDAQFVPYATTDSKVDVYDLTSGVTLVTSIDLGPVGAGRIALSPDGRSAYLGNALNGNVYELDLTSLSVVRGESNPLVLTQDFTYISDVAYTPDGRWLLAASFNTDEVYVIDPATDEANAGPYMAPFDTALDPQLLAGTANIEIAERPDAQGKYSAYVLYAVGNAVGRIDLF